MTTVNDLLVSIETQIPDVDAAGVPLYSAIPQATLILWINDASRLIALAAPVIKDWTGLPSIAGQDVYTLPANVTDVKRAWYNLLPLTMGSEGDDIFLNQISGNSWWVSPHSQTGHGNAWHLWPVPTDTHGSTTLTGNITATQSTLPITDSAGFQTYGFLTVDDELMRFASLPDPGTPGNITNVLRGQGGTTAATHLSAATVTECNIMFQVTRLPVKIVTPNDEVEIPESLWPLIELYVLAKVRSAEQNEEAALGMRREFMQWTEKMSNKAQLNKPRQGMQVKVGSNNPLLYFGRVYVP